MRWAETGRDSAEMSSRTSKGSAGGSCRPSLSREDLRDIVSAADGAVVEVQGRHVNCPATPPAHVPPVWPHGSRGQRARAPEGLPVGPRVCWGFSLGRTRRRCCWCSAGHCTFPQNLLIWLKARSMVMRQTSVFGVVAPPPPSGGVDDGLATVGGSEPSLRWVQVERHVLGHCGH